jgi:hypothetical protein
MFKLISGIGGSTSRCRFSILVIMAFMALTVSSTVQAQEHGMAVTKGCNFNVRVCSDTPGAGDVDCQDEDLCKIPDCDESKPRDLICTFTATNADQKFDTLSIPVVSPVTPFKDGVFDIVFNDATGGTGGTGLTIPSSEISIIAITGDASCAAGPSLPCIVGAGLGSVAPTDPARGAVQFEVTYTPTEQDFLHANPLEDEGHGISFDLCDGPESENGVNCSITQESDDDGSTASALIEGCLPPGDQECPPDSDLCTEDFDCNSATGLCPDPGTPTVCPPDSDLCTEDFDCDSATGECPDPGTPTVCPPDSDICTTDFDCDSTTGECPDPGTPTVCPPDSDICTTDFECDSATGEYPPPIETIPIPPECREVTELCRTPGFWGRRGGDEKSPKSQNITQQVIDGSPNGYLSVCGHQIDSTAFKDPDSAIEGICQSPKGVLERQLYRQLTSAALNCVMSGGDGVNDCSGVSIGDHFAECNDVCTGGGTLSVSTCISGLDCFNNGGIWDSDENECIHGYGLCAGDGEVCYDGMECAMFEGPCEPVETCHERVLCNEDESLCFDPPGPASSPRACNAARKNTEVQLPY